MYIQDIMQLQAKYSSFNQLFSANLALVHSIAQSQLKLASTIATAQLTVTSDLLKSENLQQACDIQRLSNIVIAEKILQNGTDNYQVLQDHSHQSSKLITPAGSIQAEEAAKTVPLSKAGIGRADKPQQDATPSDASIASPVPKKVLVKSQALKKDVITSAPNVAKKQPKAPVKAVSSKSPTAAASVKEVLKKPVVSKRENSTSSPKK